MNAPQASQSSSGPTDGSPYDAAALQTYCTALERALAHAEEEARELRFLTDEAQDPVCYVGPDARVRRASSGFAKLAGRSRKSLKGAALADIFDAEDYRLAQPFLQQALAGENVAFVARLSRPDHAVQCLRVICRPKKTAAGQVQGFVARLEDVTAADFAVEQTNPDRGPRIADRESYLAKIVQAIPEAIQVLDAQGRPYETNGAGLALLEADSPYQVIGQCMYPFVDAEYRDQYRDLHEGVFRGQPGGSLWYSATGLKGAPRMLQSTVGPLRNGSGEVIGALSVTRDVSAEIKLEAAQRLLAAIVESSNDAIISKDLNGVITSWNKAAEEMFGYTAEEVIGKRISILAVSERLNEMPKILDRVKAGERVEHYETIRKKKDGSPIQVSLTVSPVLDRSDRIIGASKIVRDITAQKEAEENLKSANAALLRANSDLEQFAYAAAHDLQEPLRMVALYTQMLKRKYAAKLDEQANEYIAFSVDGAIRMESLLRDLLVYTRTTSFQPGTLAPVPAREALEHALAMLRSQIKESGAEVIAGSLPSLQMEEVHLRQLFQNLISNAMKYRSEKTPEIRISAERTPKEWVFSVADNGIGIQSEYKDYIFGIFKRLHTSTQYPGTGLGLAICQRIVERYRGRIWVESQPGEGSTFYFSIPASE